MTMRLMIHMSDAEKCEASWGQRWNKAQQRRRDKTGATEAMGSSIR